MNKQNISAIILKHDPQNIADGGIDEYDSEAQAILTALRRCQDRDEALDSIYAIFVERFDGEDIAGPKKKYAKLAEELWDYHVSTVNSVE